MIPRTKTLSEMMSGALTPWKSARWVELSTPMAAVTASTGPSSTPAVKPSGMAIRPGTAAGSQRATGASSTSEKSRSFSAGSINAPKTSLAE